ncbi:hypothetical protein B0H34DRAFT_655044 [Crassisporium funariophilum]|nr:hypothetical protein B0H34DRAFT_655044 [Crassisporium funariophilum]
MTLAVVTARGYCAASAHQSTSDIHSLYARGIVSGENLAASYDYVIAGGGLAGLVMASRLSENSGTTVLVLEAGDSGDAVAAGVNAPAGAYYSSIVGTDYDWKHVTVPQANLSNRAIGWPRGKILGGSSAMNAMYLVRPSTTELDAWQAAIAPQGDSDGASNWGWSKMFGFMKKAENFTAPRAELAPIINIAYDASTHGSGGPMQLSYPAIMIDIVSNWTSALANAGVPELTSPNGGVTLGGFISPSSINPHNLTRSYSRSAYIDSLPPRSNLHILPSATVVRIVLSDKPDSSGNLYATGVEFAGNPTASRTTVKVKKEVILAGGPLGSPKMLMHSGVGPKDVLEGASVTMRLELPGVGQHLQDHLTAGVVWSTPLETAGNIHDSNSDFARSPEFLSFINDAVGFANITRLFNGPATDFHAQILAARDASAATLVPSNYPEVAEGYKAIYDATANKFFPDIAQLEMLMSVISPGVVSIQSAIQHPYSQGHVYINSSNPFDPIIIDPKYYSHFADVIIMRQGVKLVRQVGEAFGTAFGAEVSPGPGVVTDEQIDQWLINEAAGTQYHPASSCAMLPKAQGGVVNAKLQVYGLANVRVADSSVFPFEFAAHLASATYGLAEQASALIQANSYNVPENSASGSNPSAAGRVQTISNLFALCTLLSLALPLLI